MAAGLIERIARHGVSGERDPREDRLTEVLAAVLESPHCTGLAWHLIAGLLDVAMAGQPVAAIETVPNLCELRSLLGNDQTRWECAVQTQVHLVVDGSLRRPDLELRFATPQDGHLPEIVVAIEVKHGSDPHTDQLVAYVQRYRDRGFSHGVVLLLAPRDDYTRFHLYAHQLPENVPQLTWQQAAIVIGDYEPDGAVGRYLVDELLHYLRQEGLMDPTQLTPVHMVALANHKEAMQALNAICELAAEQIEPRADNRSEAVEHWWRFPDPCCAELAPTNAECVWSIIYDAARMLRDGRPGVPCFTAGLTIGRDAIGEGWSGLRDPLQSHRFKLLGRTDTTPVAKHDYIWRIAYPEDILAGANICAQGKALARWVQSTFDDLQKVLATPAAGGQ